MKYSTLAYLVGCAALLCMGASAQAQTIYRIVGPTGKVTFTDKPPADPAQGQTASTGAGVSATSGNPALPIELRQVAGKFPVTLYSSAKCAPCDQGRGFLTRRGIPFSERTVSTPEDSDALHRLNGDTSLPVLAIGSQRIKGYSDQEWAQYLDAAGYPKTSVLPASYRNPAPAPLVAVQTPSETPAKPAAAPVTSPTPTTPAANPNNPAGIIF